MKLLRKAVTFRSFLNRLLRKPKRVIIERLSTGVVIETQMFNNKKIIKVYGNVN
jgi:hypothetical protein